MSLGGESKVGALGRCFTSLDLDDGDARREGLVGRAALRIHAHRDGHSGPQRPEDEELRSRPRVVATHLPGFIRDQPVPPDQDLVLQIVQEPNGHVAAHRPLPCPKAFDKGIP